MKEPYRKGLANHLGPESCAGGGNAAGEALTGVHAGQVLSSEITRSVCRPCPDMGKAIRRATISREPLVGTAESETLCMCGNSMRENRETPKTPSDPCVQGRSVKVKRPYGRHVRLGESDDPIVPAKRANKAASAAAELVEGRGSTKGNVHRRRRAGHRAGEGGVRLVGRTARRNLMCVGPLNPR